MSESGLPGVRLSRAKLDATARIRIPGRTWLVDVVDLSLSGTLVERPEGMDLEVDSLASLELSCRETVTLRVQARLVRADSQHLAFVFESLGPSQEYDLRDLIDRRGSLKDGVSQ